MKKNRWLTAALVIAAAFALSLLTVYLHAKALHREYLVAYQIPRHQALLAGTAGDPWQYRILAAWIVEAVIRLGRISGLLPSMISAFLVVRVLQETLMFVAAWCYWRALGLGAAFAFMGLALFGWGVSHSGYGSDLQFNTYFDVMFYLLAATAVARGRLLWILPLTVLAALNRETSGFIPLLPLIAPATAPGDRARAIRVAAAGVALYVVVFAGLRWAYGHQELIVPYGHRPGLDLLSYNLTRARTWVQLAATVSFLPVLALVAYRAWTPVLRGIFWLVVPAWVAVHLVASVVAETRLMLVPFALVFVPGALLLLRGEERSTAAVS